MNKKKYKLTADTRTYLGRNLYRIKALTSFGDVNAGDLGGYIESENNLSQEGNAWVYDDAWVFGDAKVFDNAWVYGNAKISGNAKVYGAAWVCGNAKVFGDVEVYNSAKVFDNALVYDDAKVYGDAKVFGEAWVCDNAKICDTADYICVQGLGSAYRNTTFFKCQNGDIGVVCGCFKGNIEKFTEEVKRTHGDSKYAKEYLAMVEVIKIHFKKENGDE